MLPAETSEGPSSYGRGLWRCSDDAEIPYCYVEGADAGVSFQTAQIREDISYVLMSNTSGGVWPLCSPIRAALTRVAKDHSPS